jgi:hypothetical protein
MDIRIPFFILAAVLLAFFTWQGGKSGEIINRFSILKRAEYPRLFAVSLIIRWVFVAICGIIALAIFSGLLR